MSTRRDFINLLGGAAEACMARRLRDDIIVRKVYPQVPPKVEYSLTNWGAAMCPALDSLLEWAAARPN
jgi:DNA-binding HxlR family transcriptional regulator